MGRGKRSANVNIAREITLSAESRARALVPDALRERLIGDAHEAPEAGARVVLIRSKGPSGGVKRGERGTVQGRQGVDLEVAWDRGRQTKLRLGVDHFAVVAAEAAERRDCLEGRRLDGQSRVRLATPRSAAARKLKRGLRGTVVAVLDDGRVLVQFDQADKAPVALDPLLDELENVSGEEQAKARRRDLKRLARAGVVVGARLELTGDVPSEQRLRARMQGTVTGFRSDKIEMDWDNGDRISLLPETDGELISLLSA